MTLHAWNMLYIGLSLWLYYNNLVEIVWGKKWWCFNINYMTSLIVLNACPMYSQVVHIVCKMHVLINGCKLFAKSVKDKRKISTILIFVLKQEAVCRLTQCHSKCFPTMLQSINDITNTRWKSNDCRHHMHDLLQSIDASFWHFCCKRVVNLYFLFHHSHYQIAFFLTPSIMRARLAARSSGVACSRKAWLALRRATWFVTRYHRLFDSSNFRNLPPYECT